MRIAIITVYEPITNLGSYLQCFALKTFLEELGHDVDVIGNVPLHKQIFKYGVRLNPKRAIFLRLKKILFTIKDVSRLNVVYKKKWNPELYDVGIFGSDEIWNLHNKYFASDLFWGVNLNIPKIGYAISIGHMTEEEFNQFPQYKKSINNFLKVFPRDSKTHDMLSGLCNLNDDLVCDPTLLINADKLSLPIKPIRCRYLLVYSYGLSTKHIEYVRKFAKENDLIIVSPCFWHIWADKVIECSALQFSTLMRGADYVFTTTFHGAVFTLINHKRCCVYSQREKVGALVSSLGVSDHLLSDSSNYDDFVRIMNQDFPVEVFEKKLDTLRDYSRKEIEVILSQARNRYEIK